LALGPILSGSYAEIVTIWSRCFGISRRRGNRKSTAIGSRLQALGWLFWGRYVGRRLFSREQHAGIADMFPVDHIHGSSEGPFQLTTCISRRMNLS
jgi:hypothetical protein